MTLPSTKFAESCRDFAEYTNISGFGQMLRSSHRLELLFWLLTIVIGLVLSIRESATPIRGYLNEASLSTISVVYNETLFFSDVSLCVQVDTSELQICNTSRLEDEIELNAFSACICNPTCYKQPHFFEAFTDEIYAAAKILSKFSILENGAKNQVKARASGLIGISDHFYRRIARGEIPSTKLAIALAFLFCARMNTTITFWREDNSTVYDVCATATLTWFGVPAHASDETDLLCYNIEKFTKFQKMNEKYELSFYRENIESKGGEQGLAYLSFDDAPIATDEISNYAVVAFNQCTQVEIELTMRISLLSKRRQRCDPQRSFLECYGRCVVRELVEMCNCSAVSWELWITDEVDRKINNSSCMSRFDSPEKFEEKCSHAARERRRNGAPSCSSPKRCVDHCENNMFNLVQLQCLTQHSPNATVFVYRLYKKFYTFVQEELSYDVSTLFSNLGGIIGLWLGAGFIGILEAVFFLPKALAEYAGLTKRSRRSHEERLSMVEERLFQIEANLKSEKAARDDIRLGDLSQAENVHAIIE